MTNDSIPENIDERISISNQNEKKSLEITDTKISGNIMRSDYKYDAIYDPKFLSKLHNVRYRENKLQKDDEHSW